MFRRLSFLVFIFTSALSLEILFSEDNETIVSPSSIFELGLFKDGTRWYLGIWFKGFPRKVVWTGNRESPLNSARGYIQISMSSGIQLFNESGYMTWKINLTRTAAADAPLTASLSDTGNLIVSYNNNNPNGILWQSFDEPGDVLLPGMDLGMGLSSGRFYYYRETAYQYYIWEFSTKMYRVDPIYYGTISLPRATTINYHATLTLLATGSLSLSEWTSEDTEWKEMLIAPSDTCDKYATCGANTNTYCSMNPLKSCECFPGFRPLRGNCVRKSPVTCSDDDGFQLLKNMKLPETDSWTILYEGVGLEECKERCLKTCNCTAFANTDMPISGWSCVMWTVSLADTRRYSTNRGQNLYVRVAGLAMAIRW
ncbi:unnamed protein product [Eruca vesicaria subsp. sativa]|uniref:Uncharacterized protein n=1 Tax=Eruca vesicaria subsp. sativa TaxID=29727 RepID=A0ABC8JFR3_ERUVS|nr:unnamed protein product [Eruca vesicaria subsp. sativa]